MKNSVQHAELGVDGNCGFALLGENIQVGEAEFEPVKEVVTHNVVNLQTGQIVVENMSLEDRQDMAIRIAFKRLRDRLDPAREWLTYYIGQSHPRHC